MNMYEFNRIEKNQFEQKLTHFKITWIQKLTQWVNLWAHKLSLWMRDTIYLHNAKGISSF